MKALLAMAHACLIAVAAFVFGNEALAFALALAPVVLIRPAVGGYVLVSVGVLTMTFTGLSIGPITLPDVFLVAGGMMLLLTRRRPAAPPSWVLVGGLGVLAAALAGTFVAGEMAPRLSGAMRLAIAMIYLPTVIVWAGASAGCRRSLAACYVLSASFNALVAVLVSAGIAVIQSEHIPISSSFNGYRVAGLSAHSNQLGLSCALALPLVMTLYRTSRLWLVAGGTCIAGIGLSGSRTGLLAAGIGLLIHLIISKRIGVRSMARVAAIGVAGIAALVFLGINISFDRLIGETPQVSVANEERIATAAHAWGDFRESPLIGVGYKGAHNLYLTIAQGGGLLALAAFTAYVWGAIRVGRSVRDDPIGAGGFSILLLWLAAGITHNGYYDRYLYFGFGLVLAASMETRRQRRSDAVAGGQLAPQPSMARSPSLAPVVGSPGP